MGAYSIRPEETELSQLVDRAASGEEVVLARDGKPVAKMIAFPKVTEIEGKVYRRPGMMALSADWLEVLDAPLHQDEQQAFGMVD